MHPRQNHKQSASINLVFVVKGYQNSSKKEPTGERRGDDLAHGRFLRLISGSWESEVFLWQSSDIWAPRHPVP